MQRLIQWYVCMDSVIPKKESLNSHSSPLWPQELLTDMAYIAILEAMASGNKTTNTMACYSLPLVSRLI